MSFQILPTGGGNPLLKVAGMSLQEKKALEGRGLVASADKHLETSAWKLKFR